MADASHPLTRMLGIIYALCSAYSACCTVHLFVTGARPKIPQRQTLQRATSEVAREFWAVTLAHTYYDVHIWWVITLCSRPSKLHSRWARLLGGCNFSTSPGCSICEIHWSGANRRRIRGFRAAFHAVNLFLSISDFFWKTLALIWERLSFILYLLIFWLVFPMFFLFFLFGWLIDDSSWRFLRLWTMPPKRCLGSSATWAGNCAQQVAASKVQGLEV